jgi:N-acetylneuraminic acid mutarotase
MKKIYLLAALLFLFSSLSGQTEWSKYIGNPVLKTETEDDGASRGGPVVYHDNTYHMWYSKSLNDTIDANIGYATSSDGIQWTKYGDNPVLVCGPEGSWDESKIFFPTVLIRDNVFHMWYLGQPSGSDYHEHKIGHATSTDGIHWEKDPQNPVLIKGPEGSPDANYILGLSAAHDDSLFHLWYGANNAMDDFLYTCHATSPDGIAWTKDPYNQVLKGDGWDSPLCIPGPVVFDGSVFRMWYTGGEAGDTRKIGYAASLDGTDWVKPADSPVLSGGQPGEWDEGAVAVRGILYDSTNQKYLMWYSGTNGIGYAQSEPRDLQEAWKLMNNFALGNKTCVSDNLIYVFAGGGEDWWIGDETWCYNTNTDLWTRLADMPMAMTSGGVGQVGDKIYLVAGWRNTSGSDDSWITVDSIQEYDIARDTFIFKQKAPYRMASMISCMMHDEMYLFGGIGIPGELTYPYKARTYDPVSGQWDTTLPDMQYPHLLHGTAEVLKGDIYVIGGHGATPDFIIARSEKFNGQEWTPIAEMPVPSVNHTSVVHDNKILVFGGDSLWTRQKSNSMDLIQEYDPLTDSWKLMEPMPFRRNSMGGGKVENSVYLIGGLLDQRDPGTWNSEVWRFNLDSLQEWCEEVSITEPSDSLEIGNELTLTANVLPSDFANKDIIWSSGNGSVVTVLDSIKGIFRGESEGTATITASLKYGSCIDSYTLAVIDTVTNIKPNSALVYFTLYPNPVKDLLNIHLNSNGDHKIEIVALTGQVVYSDLMESSEYIIDFSDYEKGIYFVSIRSKEFVTTRKIIKLL